MRRRSRRVVKTEDDLPVATEQGFSETPPPVAQVAPVLEGFSPQTSALFSAAKSPPPPPPEQSAAPPPIEIAPEPPPPPLMDPSEVMEVIQPMRILSIGDDLPPVSVPTPGTPEVAVAEAPVVPPRPKARVIDEIPEEGWTPPPPKVAEISAALAADTAQTNVAPFVAKDSAVPPPLPTKEATPPPLPAREPVAVATNEATPAPVRIEVISPPVVTEASAEIELEPVSKDEVELAASSEPATPDDIEPLEEAEDLVVEAAAPPPVQPTPTPGAAGPKKPPPPLPPKAPPPVKAGSATDL